MKFNKLDVPYQWKEYFTKYPHGYTIFEALCSWTKQVDEMVGNINDWNKYLDDFTKKFDKELQKEVTNTLSDWQKSGFLDVVIDEALQTQMDVLEDETNRKLGLFEAHLAEKAIHLKVTNNDDITQDIKHALNLLTLSGGGTLYIPYLQGGYNIIEGEITLPSNVTIDFNFNDFYIDPVLGKQKTLFKGVNLNNVTLKNGFFHSENVYERHITRDGTPDGVPRSGLGSNINGFHLHGENITIDNIYFNSFEFGIQIKNTWDGAVGLSKNIVIKNYKTYATKQPLYMTNVENSFFYDFDLDLFGGTDSYDHHIYLNGDTNNLFFERLIFKNGHNVSFNLKTNDVLYPKNRNITIKGLKILDTDGFNIDRTENLTISDLVIKNAINRPVFKLSSCENIQVTDFIIDNCGGFLDTYSNILAKNILFTNGTVNNVNSEHVMETRMVDSMQVKNVIFDNLSISESGHLVYGPPSSSVNMKITDCLIYTDNLSASPISFRGDGLMFVSRCEFIYRKGGIRFGVFDNRGNTKVIASNNIYQGYGSLKSSADTGTVDINNFDISDTV